MNKWLKIIHYWVGSCLRIPCYCILCLKPSLRGFALCTHCEDFLPFLTVACEHCGIPLPQKTDHALCEQCLVYPPAFDRLQALFTYQRPVNGFIGRLKYNSELHFATLLGTLMAERLYFCYPIDCIVAVPLHPTRQKQRGFNQSLVIAKVIAKHWQLPLNKWQCTKVQNTHIQSRLPASARFRNITCNAFRISPHFKAKHVLVIEDVVTTGTTVQALALALKASGVCTVEVWSCCRTPA